MDLHLASPGPFTYLVGEHARAVVAIQELQREVNSLLAFRDHVLEALPHLQLREPSGPATPRPRPSSQAPGGKSLSEGPPTVVDSGFSTDKASTSMGKSSSSSSGELSGGRWPLGDPSEGVVPLGSAEDELWTLLEVIERKGTRLRRDLERAEVRERELGHASDPTGGGDVSSPPLTEKWRGPGGDWWPHSLPGAGPRLDFVPGLEAWGEVERLRVDRLYLMGRLQRAEAEGGVAHQRLLDLHSQLLALAGEKRRLEDAFRAFKVGDLSPGVSGVMKGGRGVTVSVGGEAATRRSSSVRIGEDIFLPRVLKVPIKDKWGSKPPSKIPQGIGCSPKSDTPSPSKTIVLFPSSKSSGSAEPSLGGSVAVAPAGICTTPLGGDRVVIERERNPNRVDGGLSMPASLLKGARIKVRPNKQRISAILKEKDVLALQRQLLTTVMETEVLRRQLEMAGEEWEGKLREWESERHKHRELQSNVKAESIALKQQLEHYRNIRRVDVGVTAVPLTHSVSVGTSDESEAPTFSVHQGPNVKYDVVVFEESSSGSGSPKQPKPPPITLGSRKPQLTIEKPPRRTRPLSVGPGGETHSFGRDSLGRVAKIPLKPSTRTPPATPRSSPAPSMSISRSSGGRTPTLDGSSQAPRSSSLVSGNGRPSVGRRDSIKSGGIGTPNSGTASPAGKGGPSGGPHKNTPWLHRKENGTIRTLSQVKGLSANAVSSSSSCRTSDATSEPKAKDILSDSNNFFDSISEGTSFPGYSYDLHHTQFLPPSPRLWTPIYGNNLPLQKGMPQRTEMLCSSNWGQHHGRNWSERSPLSDSLELPSADFESSTALSRDRLNEAPHPYKGLRYKAPGGVLRIKKTQERPSVLSMENSKNSQMKAMPRANSAHIF